MRAVVFVKRGCRAAGAFVVALVIAVLMSLIPAVPGAEAAVGGPASLSLSPSDGLEPGALIQAIGDCGTVPDTGYRVVELSDGSVTGSGDYRYEVVWADNGAWDGSFVVNVPTEGVSPYQDGRYGVRLTCNYGLSGAMYPNQTAEATYLTYPASIGGTVTWSDGVPVRDVDVIIREDGGNTQVRALSTNADGEYGPTRLPTTMYWGGFDSEYRIWFVRDGVVVGTETDIWLDPGDEAAIDHVISVPDPGSVVGTVEWLSGDAFAGEDVRLLGTDFRGSPVNAVTQTDSNGQYAFDDVAHGDYVVRAIFETSVVAEGGVVVGSDADHVVDLVANLGAPGTVTGRATYSDGTNVVTDNPASLFGNVELSSPSGTRYAHSDVGGQFRFDGVTPGDYDLRVTGTYLPGYEYRSDLIPVEVTPAGTVDQHVVLDLPTSTVSGAVVSSVDSSPVAGVVVSIPSMGFEDTTTASGSFEIGGIEGAGKPFTIEVRDAGETLLGTQDWAFAAPGEASNFTIHVDPVEDPDDPEPDPTDPEDPEPDPEDPEPEDPTDPEDPEPEDPEPDPEDPEPEDPTDEPGPDDPHEPNEPTVPIDVPESEADDSDDPDEVGDDTDDHHAGDDAVESDPDADGERSADADAAERTTVVTELPRTGTRGLLALVMTAVVLLASGTALESYGRRRTGGRVAGRHDGAAGR